MSEKLGGGYVELGADTTKLEKGCDAAARATEALEKKVQKVLKGLEAPSRAEERMGILAQAVERAGGVAALSARQVENLTRQLGYLAKSGAQVPTALAGLIPAGPTQAMRATSAAMESLKGSATSMAGSLGPAGSALTALGPVGLVAAAGVAAATAAVGKLISTLIAWSAEGMKLADDIVETADSLSYSTDGLQEWHFAAQQAGMSAESFDKAAFTLTQKLAEGGEKTKAAVGALGLSFEELAGYQPEQQMEVVLHAMQRLADPGLRAELAREFFDKGARESLKLIASNFDDARASAVKLGPEVLASMGGMNDRLDAVSDAWQKAKAAFTAGLTTSPEGARALEDIALALGEVTLKLLEAAPAVSAVVDQLVRLGRVWTDAVGNIGGIAGLANLATGGASGLITEGVGKLGRGASAGGSPSGAKGDAYYTAMVKVRQAEANLLKVIAGAENERKKAEDERAKAAAKAAAEYKKSGEFAVEDFEAMAAYANERAKADADWSALLDKANEKSRALAKGGLNDLVEGHDKLAQARLKAFAKGQAEEAAADLKDLEEAERAAAAAARKHAEEVERLARTFDKIGQVAGQLGSIFGEMGMEGAEAWANIAEGAAGVAKAYATGDFVGMFKSAFDLGQSIGALFVDTEEEIDAAHIQRQFRDLGLEASEEFMAGLTAMDDVLAAWSMTVLERLKETGRSASSLAGDELGLVFAESSTRGAEGLENIRSLLEAIGDEAGRGVPGSMDAMQEAIDLVYQQMSTGQMSAVTGAELLGGAFQDLQAAADNGIGGAAEQMRELIAQSRAAGVEVAGLDEYIRGMQSTAGEDLTKIFGEMTDKGIVGGIQLGFQDEAALFAQDFSAILAEQGLPAAVEEMGGAWAAIQAEMASLTQEQRDALLGDIPELMGLVSEETKPIFDAIQATTSTVERAGTTGHTTAAGFAAAQGAALAEYGQLIEKGATPEAAMAAISDLLAALQQEGEAGNLPLTEGIQALIEQSDMVMLEDASERTASVLQDRIAPSLEEMVRLQGGFIPAIEGIDGPTLAATIPTLTPLADGGIALRALPAFIAEAGPEVVAPLDRFPAMIEEAMTSALRRGGAGQGGAGGSLRLTDAAGRILAELVTDEVVVGGGSSSRKLAEWVATGERG